MSFSLDNIKPLSKGQEILLSALKSNKYTITGIFGPSGTGKSLLSCAYAIDSLIKKTFKRFIIIRPLIDVKTGKEITSLELGNLYYRIVSSYLEDILVDFFSTDSLRKMINEGKIIVADSHFLRGRTFDDSIIFLDDSQSASPEVVSEIVMRIGRNSKLIIAGDPIFQSYERDNRVRLIREALLGEKNTIVVDLGLKDIVRPGAKRGIKLALEMMLLKRDLNDIEKSVLSSAKIKAPDTEILTVIEFTQEKKKFNLLSENVPDALIIVKEGYLGRLVGKGGERIQSMEKETGFKLRGIELTLNFKNVISAVHPISWIGKHILDVDLVGVDLQVTVRGSEIGGFLGQKGKNIRFLEHAFKRLFNVGIKIVRKEKAHSK